LGLVNRKVIFSVFLINKSKNGGNQMKKVLSLVLVVCFTFLGFTAYAQSATAPAAKAKFHIGIVTGTLSQSEDETRGAEQLIKLYGDVKNGGMIKHITYPDLFASEQETVISEIQGLADDPLMKAIVVNQAVPGTTSAFQNIRDERPDILLLAAMPQEDPGMIEAAADLVVDSNNIDRGYYIIKNAKLMGAKTFIHLSFPRHMSIELLSRRRTIMEAACKDLGVKFVFETVPDPVSDVGVAGACQAVLEKVPQLVAKYGKNTAFFCTNDAQTEPLVKEVAELGAIFVEADTPSPLMGYPGALGLDLKKEAGNWPAIVKKIENKVVSMGQKGRMGTSAFSFSYCMSAGLGEYAKNYIESKAKKIDTAAALKAFGKFTPGAAWNFSLYSDAKTKVVAKNHMLILQDTYILGKGYSGVIKTKVPAKYLNLK
jgi:hypothetical protein